MSTAQHTPGPWFNAGSTNNIYPGFYIRSQHKPGYLAEVRAFTDQREVEANARLIAAAPDLLESLRECLDLIETISPIEGDAIRHARAAIAAATLAKGEGKV